MMCFWLPCVKMTIGKEKSLVGNEREAVSETLGIENGGLGGMD